MTQICTSHNPWHRAEFCFPKVEAIFNENQYHCECAVGDSDDKENIIRLHYWPEPPKIISYNFSMRIHGAWRDANFSTSSFEDNNFRLIVIFFFSDQRKFIFGTLFTFPKIFLRAFRYLGRCSENELPLESLINFAGRVSASVLTRSQPTMVVCQMKLLCKLYLVS